MAEFTQTELMIIASSLEQLFIRQTQDIANPMTISDTRKILMKIWKMIEENAGNT